MDVLDLFIHDHKTIKRLFKQVRHARDIKKRRQIFTYIDADLSAHAHLEEAVFYPEIEQYEELKEMVEEALEQHEEITDLLAEMGNIGKDDDFDTALQELIENVEVHFEGEESELFAKVRELFDEVTLEKWGDRLEAAKDQEQQLQLG